MAAQRGTDVTGYGTGRIGSKAYNLDSPKPEDPVQLAVGYLLRRLDDLGMSKAIWLDTSRGGLEDTDVKPDFTMYRTTEKWTTVVSLVTVSED